MPVVAEGEERKPRKWARWLALAVGTAVLAVVLLVVALLVPIPPQGAEYEFFGMMILADELDTRSPEGRATASMIPHGIEFCPFKSVPVGPASVLRDLWRLRIRLANRVYDLDLIIR